MLTIWRLRAIVDRRLSGQPAERNHSLIFCNIWMFPWWRAIGSAPCTRCLSLQRFQHPSGGATRQTSTGPPFLHDWPADVCSLPPLLPGHRDPLRLYGSADTCRSRIVTKCPILHSQYAHWLLYKGVSTRFN